jgi:hypothetical protein
MMRTIHFVVILLDLLLVLSPLTGCGGGEEPSQEDVPAPSEPQVKEEPKEGRSEEGAVEVSPHSELPVETEIKAEAAVIVDEIIIENQGYTEDRKKPVKLNHKKHAEEYGIACASCHHVYEEGENIWEQGDPVGKCVACHDPVADQDGVMKLQSAFHKNCRDCHKEVTQEVREAAPYKKCTACHS